jgi:predicted AAA+ superfamily ATPase
LIFIQPRAEDAVPMLDRLLLARVRAATADTPVVFLQGARQSGKSTLLKALLEAEGGPRYVTLDEPSILGSARADPVGFLAGLGRRAAIDEVQACPELFGAIKLEVDRDRTPGRYLLSGSANALVVPELARALAGRVELLTLRGFSQGEIAGVREDLVDWMFSAKPPADGFEAVRNLPARITTGGFPEVVARRGAERRAAWFDSYITTLLQRDVRDLAQIEGLGQLPDLLRLCAARSGGLLNHAEFSRTLGLPQTTLKRYFALLEAVFLVQRVPAWSANLGKRLVRTSKLYLLDTGLACHLQGLTAESWEDPNTRRGPLLENFVFSELDKQLGWARTRAKLHHYRTHSGDEVDFLLEDASGRIAAIEVKASRSVSTSDVAPIRKLSAELGERFVRGVVLYAGREVVPFARNVHALPMAALWSPMLDRG